MRTHKAVNGALHLATIRWKFHSAKQAYVIHSSVAFLIAVTPQKTEEAKRNFQDGFKTKFWVR